MNEITLNVYNKDFTKVKKVLKATPTKIGFAEMSTLLKITKLDDTDNVGETLAVVYNAWEDITAILGRVFKTAKPEDWKTVAADEVAGSILEIVQYAFFESKSIPVDEKN